MECLCYVFLIVGWIFEEKDFKWKLEKIEMLYLN